MRVPLHPPRLRCSSVEYCRYAPAPSIMTDPVEIESEECRGAMAIRLTAEPARSRPANDRAPDRMAPIGIRAPDGLFYLILLCAMPAGRRCWESAFHCRTTGTATASGRPFLTAC